MDPTEAKIPIRARELIWYIRSGMADSELMEKYGLTAKRLKKVYQKLIEEKLIDHDELYERSPLFRKLVDEFQARRSPRVELTVPLWIFDVVSSARGIVRDISESGLRIAGLQTAVGDERSLQLSVDMFFGLDPFVFSATCVWGETKGKNLRYYVAGYKMTDISETGKQTLRRLISLLLLSKSGEWTTLK
jgi:hypothetical protein